MGEISKQCWVVRGCGAADGYTSVYDSLDGLVGFLRRLSEEAKQAHNSQHDVTVTIFPTELYSAGA